MMERGLRWAVQARRKRRGAEREQTQDRCKARKCVSEVERCQKDETSGKGQSQWRKRRTRRNGRIWREREHEDDEE